MSIVSTFIRRLASVSIVWSTWVPLMVAWLDRNAVLEVAGADGTRLRGCLLGAGEQAVQGDA